MFGKFEICSSKCPRPGSNPSPSVPGSLRTFAESPAFSPPPTSILRPLPSTSVHKHLVQEKKHHAEKNHRAREKKHRAGEKQHLTQEKKHPMRRRINTLCAGEKTPYAQDKKTPSQDKKHPEEDNKHPALYIYIYIYIYIYYVYYNVYTHNVGHAHYTHIMHEDIRGHIVFAPYTLFGGPPLRAGTNCPASLQDIWVQTTLLLRNAGVPAAVTDVQRRGCDHDSKRSRQHLRKSISNQMIHARRLQTTHLLSSLKALQEFQRSSKTCWSRTAQRASETVGLYPFDSIIN